jgi:hypothetical protein
MYMTAPDYGVEDFLRAINFITPRGTNLSYFIVNKGADFQLPNQAPFTQVELPEDDSISYQRTEPILKQDVADAPPEYIFWDPPKLGYRQPAPPRIVKSTEPEELESPFVRVLSESSDLVPEDIVLRESWECFPRGTIFHFKPKRMRESYEDDFGDYDYLNDDGLSKRDESNHTIPWFSHSLIKKGEFPELLESIRRRYE